MSNGFFSGWKSFRDTVDDTTSTIRGVFWVVGVVAVFIIVLGNWLATLNTIQITALWIAGVCLALIIFTYYLDWSRKRSIDNIPELLAQLDQLTLDYIDGYIIKNAPEALLNDLAKMMNMDIGNLKTAACSGNKKQAEQAFAQFVEKSSRYSNPKKFQENIMTLRLMGGLMNEYDSGLARVTNTAEYQRVYRRIQQLRKRLPSAVISAKINEYFHQSDGLYSVLLSIKPFESLGTLKEMIPARIRAHSDVMRPIIEGHINTLISGVRESINDYKQRGKSRKDEGKAR